MKLQLHAVPGRPQRPRHRDVAMVGVATLVILALTVVGCADMMAPFRAFSGALSMSRSRGETDPLERALRILNAAPIIDTHNDLPFKIRELNRGFVGNLSLESLPFPRYHTGLELSSGLPSKHFSLQPPSLHESSIPCGDYTKQSNDVRDTLDQIDLIKSIVEKYSEIFTMAYSTLDIYKIRKSGKIASLIGIEGMTMSSRSKVLIVIDLGAHQIDNSLSTLRQLYTLGVRYMTLTHVCHTSWADACFGAPLHNGLSKEGEKFIAEMNRLGMLVDLSHVSDQTMHRVMEVSRAPVIFSHSSVRSICPSPRNVPDEVLSKLSDLDGVVMINFSPGFISCGVNGVAAPNATLEEVADHIEYIKRMIGAKHIGIGGDFDGIPNTPIGLEDVSKYPYLIAELLRRNFTDEEVVGITGGNLMRVFEKTESVARQLQSQGFGKVEGQIQVDKTCSEL
ncbi:dipeptidase 1 (renal) [Dinochytrium kinnereticum]|nr:dipeptidase 1 (renal) [Dinochytrium kinnereticum]